MARTYLDDLVDERLRRFSFKRQFSPIVIFDFDHVRAAIASVETAIKAAQKETDEASGAAVVEAAADPDRDFMEKPLLAPIFIEWWGVNMTFPLILRRSMFIAVCS